MKTTTLLILVTLNVFADDGYEAYRQSIAEEYNAYYQKEMKAYQAFIQTSDGIPNKINPYQKINIVPPRPVITKVVAPPVVKPTVPLPSSKVTPPIVKVVIPKVEPIVPEGKILEKPQNMIPKGTPSGSQIDTVKLEKIDVSKLIAPPPPLISQTPSTITVQSMQLSFFGTSIPIDQNAVAFTKTLQPSKEVSDLADEIHAHDTLLINRLKAIRNEYSLNDWDMVVFAQALMNTIYSAKDQKLKTLHIIDVLRGLGYKTLLAEGTDKKLYFLVPTKQPLYSKSFFEREGGKYYLFAVDEHPRADAKVSISFYKSADDGQGSPLDMRMLKDPLIGVDPQTVNLKWDFENKKYTMNVTLNKNLTALMDMYPQVENDAYLQSRSGVKLVRGLASNLLNEIQKNHFTQEQSIAFILRFAQQAFTYKTDFDAYGYERPMFVEQTILLPYSDCEDRAILLSRLYQEALGLDTVGLRYPGHLALGVSYSGKGDYYTTQNKNYYVTDGTYFYANPGMSQPSFKNVAAKFLGTK
ncbi:MAG: hypothetical protein NTY39_07365 [Campylobacterales bacterium]|nr:hypothetical protein [Campylobacterales bacterium]